MSVNAAVYKRVLRRETHSSRTASAVTLAVVLLVIFVAASVFAVWNFVDDRVNAWTQTQLESLSSTVPLEAVSVSAGLLLLVALVLVTLSITPGRQNRKGLIGERSTLVIDDGVLADAVVERVAHACHLARSQVSVIVKRRSISVRVTPTTGVGVLEGSVNNAAQKAASELGFTLSVRVVIEQSGVIG